MGWTYDSVVREVYGGDLGGKRGREIIAERVHPEHGPTIAAVPELVEACEELREAVAACFRVIAAVGDHTIAPETMMDSLERELARCGIADGFGVRAQAALAAAKGEQ